MIPTRTLSNGVEMPAIGMGTYPLVGQQLTDVSGWAYQAGYRLFDTADNYYNEEDLGASLAHLYSTSSAKRDELFLVTKISDELYRPGTLGGGANRGIYFWKNSPVMQQPDAVRRIVEQKVENSLRALRTDYIDLLLMHWPYPDFFAEIWQEMERVYQSGKVRAIGVCNCRQRHFEKLKQSQTIAPMVNQFETSPLNTKASLVDYCSREQIQVMVYSPLMNLKYKSRNGYDTLLRTLAQRYGKSEGQIVLRSHVQRGLIPIPKSVHESRLISNIDIFDFQLTPSEMEQLLAVNINLQTLPESRSCPGL